MVRGFLQGFNADHILGEHVLQHLGSYSYDQALHLAMLGMAEEAHAIFSLLKEHDLEPIDYRGFSSAIKLFYRAWHESDPEAAKASPFGDEEFDVRAMQLKNIEDNTYSLNTVPNNRGEGLDLSEVTVRRFKEMQDLAIELATKDPVKANSRRYSETAGKLSRALLCLLYMADRLDYQADVQNTLMSMATRIHAEDQATLLPLLSVAWEKLLLNGGLREAMELTVPDVKDYADFVLGTLRRRFENRPVHPDTVYAGKSMRELLDELNRNTLEDPEFDVHDWYFDQDPPKSVFRDPATDKDIAKMEKKMGRSLPDELKEFLKITNGCAEVGIGDGMRKRRFVPVEDMELENDGYMDDYGFSLLPEFSVDVQGEETEDGQEEEEDEEEEEEGEEEEEEGKEEGGKEDGGEAEGPEDEEGDDEETDFMDDRYSLSIQFAERFGGGIAMYEHDGQGTDYTWILSKETVDAARRRVQIVYDRVDDEQKRRIDEAIVQRYGSREVYDSMEYCIDVQQWGDSQSGAYASFGSYLRSVVYESRLNVERSPVKVPEE